MINTDGLKKKFGIGKSREEEVEEIRAKKYNALANKEERQALNEVSRRRMHNRMARASRKRNRPSKHVSPVVRKRRRQRRRINQAKEQE